MVAEQDGDRTVEGRRDGCMTVADDDSAGRPGRVRRWAGACSLAAGLVHGGVAPAHLDEWWGYGLFFLVAATCQFILGLALLTDAINPKDTGPSWLAWRRRMCVAGIAGNVAIMALYGVTRTVGIPLLGPEAGAVEAVAPIDVVSKALEAAVIGLLIALARSHE